MPIRSFFTGARLEIVREAVSIAGMFCVSPGFDLWKGLCSLRLVDLISQYWSLYCKCLLERRNTCESYYVELKRANHESRSRQSSGSVETGSAPGSVVRMKKTEPRKSRLASKESVDRDVPNTKVSTKVKSRKNAGKAGAAVDTEVGVASTSKKSEKKIAGVDISSLA